MLLLTPILLTLYSATVLANKDFGFLLSGFNHASLVPSSGGKAVCAAGDVWVNITATNERLLFDAPPNNTVATEDIVELLQANPTIYERANGGNNTFSGKFRISSRLCYPAGATKPKDVKTVQLLTHGFTLDKGYWDIPGFSYVDAAAEAGYATFAYDRLGVGQSAHPDPIQIVQLPAEVEITHGLAQLLRTGAVGGRPFNSIAGGGHSLGSIITTGVTAKYPRDLDAAILTGFTANVTGGGLTIAAISLQIANTFARRFRDLPNGYLTPSSPLGVQFSFYRFPFFDQAVFDAQFAGEQTGTFGELFGINNATMRSPNFTGPVDIVTSLFDIPFCLGDCTFPTDLAAATIPALYPDAAAGSRSFLVPRTGHNINAHFGAPVAYNQINTFLRDNGF